MYFSQQQINRQTNIKTTITSKCKPNPTTSQTQIQNSVSSMAWNNSRTTEKPLLAYTQWSGDLKVHQLAVSPRFDITADKKANFKFENVSLLRCVWDHQHPSLVYCGDSQGGIFSFDVSKQIQSKFPIEDRQNSNASAISSLIWNKHFGLMVSTSYKNIAKVWDCRQQKEVAKLNLQGKVHCSASNSTLMAFGLSNYKIEFVDFRKTGTEHTWIPSPFKEFSTIQSMDLHQSQNILLAGSGDGRIAICSIHNQESQTASRFRQQNPLLMDVHFKQAQEERSKQKHRIYYPVNCVGFSPSNPDWIYSASASCRISFFDYKNMKLIKAQNFQSPITACSLSEDGGCIAYAMGNDWHTGRNEEWPTQITVRLMTENDYQSKK